MSNRRGAAQTPTQSGAVEAIASITALDADQVSGVLLVSEFPEDEYELTQLRPTVNAAPALLEVGESALRLYRECEVIDYAPATSCVGKQVMWMPLEDVPLLDAVVNDSADLANIELFDPRKAKLASSRMSAIRVDSASGPIVFIQAISESQVVARSTKLGVLVKKGVIDIPKGELLLLNQGVTATALGRYILFSNRAAFQRLFRLLEELRERAKATFREVTAELKIDGFDQLLAAVTTQSAMLSKMASIQAKIDKYPKYKKALTMPKVLAFVRTHPECQVELSGDGDSAQLVFRSDPQHRFKILKLLDDDYLRSELTTLEYEANSKGAPIG